MPLGKEIGLGLGHIVLDGDPVGSQRPHSSPSSLFGPCLLWSPIPATAELLFNMAAVRHLGCISHVFRSPNEAYLMIFITAQTLVESTQNFDYMQVLIFTSYGLIENAYPRP